MNVLEQIRAREQAATGGQWQSIGKSVCTVDTHASVGHAPNAYAGGVCNCLGDGMRDKATPVNVKARANAAHIVSAHNHMPLLLAAAEAAAVLIDVEPVYGDDNCGYRHCAVCGANDRYAMFGDFPHEADCEWLLAKAAIAPLLKEEVE